MNTYPFSSRSLPFNDSWDVIVVGGGPAGCSAAIAAAREGAKTLLVESTGSLGGAGTNALVPAWCPFSDSEKIIYRGLAEKIFEAAKKGIAHIRQSDLDWVPIDSERLKRVYDQFVTESGATVLFHTVLSAVEMAESGQVSALIVSNKTGLSALGAKVYIDATGDADLAAWAGAQFLKGDENGDVQPATHCFMLANVDEEAFRTGPCLYGGSPESPIHAAIASGRYPEISDDHLCSNLVGPGTVGFNAGHLFQVDATDPQSVSQALIAGRKIAMAYRNALAEFFPSAFSKAFLVSTAPVMGIRESRRVIGDYILSAEDYLARRSFDDEICRNSYFIDIHYTKEESRRKGVDVTKRFERYKPGESHGIPYRCLTPKGLKNVLVAGRSISCERVVQGSVRVMPVCLAMGEAAGIASAYAANTGTPDVHAVDTHRLRARLREMNAYLP